MVIEVASCVIVASCPRLPAPPRPPAAAGSGTTVHLPAKFGVCARTVAVKRIASGMLKAARAGLIIGLREYRIIASGGNLALVASGRHADRAWGPILSQSGGPF